MLQSLARHQDTNMRAMLLAAGRGERLRPLTDQTPKPMIEINGGTLIARHLVALEKAGVSEVVINISWLGERIRDYLGDGSRWGMTIAYSPEPPGALETAGGIRRALPLLDTDCFLVVSTDVLTDFDYGSLVELEPDGLAHLVMVDNPPHHPSGDFSLTRGGMLQVGDSDNLTYSGIGIYRSEMFAGLDPNTAMPLRPLLNEAIGKQSLSGVHYRGRWLDVGSPRRLALARQQDW